MQDVLHLLDDFDIEIDYQMSEDDNNDSYKKIYQPLKHKTRP